MPKVFMSPIGAGSKFDNRDYVGQDYGAQEEAKRILYQTEPWPMHEIRIRDLDHRSRMALSESIAAFIVEPRYASSDLRVVCTVRHLVDQDDNRSMRWAEVGEIGTVYPGTTSNPYNVVWPNGATGFYSRSELFELCEVAS